MVLNDEWTEGLTSQQQKCIVDYVMDGCKPQKGQGGYKTTRTVMNFIQSEKGRKALRKYCEFFFDLKKDSVRLHLLRIYMQRAFFNPADIIDKRGMILEKYKDNLKELGDLAYVIDGIKLNTQSLEVKLCDRDKAVDFISRLFRIFENDFEADISDEKNVWQMTDEERDEEIKRLIQKTGYLPEPEKKGKK